MENIVCTVLLLLLLLTVPVTTIYMEEDVNEPYSYKSGEWFTPFDQPTFVARLCTDFNDFFFVQNGDPERVKFYMEGHLLAFDEAYRFVPARFAEMVWFMRALQFHLINNAFFHQRSGFFGRGFQHQFMRFSYIRLCNRTHLLKSSERKNDQFAFHVALFNMLFRKENDDRKLVCRHMLQKYTDLYGRCHVPLESRRHFDMEQLCWSGSTIGTTTFFRRFGRTACGFAASAEYFAAELGNRSLSEALVEDVTFMNLLSEQLLKSVNNDSELAGVVLKTRLLLQHFNLAAYKLHQQIKQIQSCWTGFLATRNESLTNVSESAPPPPLLMMDRPPPECCRQHDSLDCELLQDGRFESLNDVAVFGMHVEAVLLFVVAFHSVLLSVLLALTIKHISTATVLFIFNIVFTNLLFFASFALLYTDLLDDEPFGSVTDGFQYKTAELVVAETLQTHLFAADEFQKHLVQELLFSVAQNGSLIGFMILLCLVLVVMNRSLAGQSVRLSKIKVSSIFFLAWIILIATHVIFSILQISAIRSLDALFTALSNSDEYLECNAPPRSEYSLVSWICDRTAVFHTWGAYLLRGHTIFTLFFLVVSVVILVVAIGHHYKVRRDNDILHNALREQSNHRRREILFHTLLLSLGAFLASVLAQTYVELAVFWSAPNRNEVAVLASRWQWARFGAFIDPCLNPIIVIYRTPALRRQMRLMWRLARQRAGFATSDSPVALQHPSAQRKRSGDGKKTARRRAGSDPQTRAARQACCF